MARILRWSSQHVHDTCVDRARGEGSRRCAGCHRTAGFPCGMAQPGARCVPSGNHQRKYSAFTVSLSVQRRQENARAGSCQRVLRWSDTLGDEIDGVDAHVHRKRKGCRRPVLRVRRHLIVQLRPWCQCPLYSTGMVVWRSKILRGLKSRGALRACDVALLSCCPMHANFSASGVCWHGSHAACVKRTAACVTGEGRWQAGTGEDAANLSTSG